MNNHSIKNFPYLIALILFVLSAIYGLIIRFNFVFPIEGFGYKNFLQSHSHVAFLGWGYVSVVGIIIHSFVAKENAKKKVYNLLLWIIIITVSLMLISFPLVGYKLFSIVLLCVFGLTSYVVSYRLLKDVKGNKSSVKLIRVGIYFYLLSSLATWFLPYVLITQGKTNLYYNTVYFYLHFLYNGFFVFALFGLFFKLIENQNIKVSEKHQNLFYIFLSFACIPAYVLSILWSNVSMAYNVIGFIAGILQLVSLVYLWRILKNTRFQLKWNSISKLLLKFGIVAYSLKVIFQILSAFPYIVTKSLALKPFLIIGYLHLFTLGFMSVFIFLLLNQLHKFYLDKGIAKLGVFIFLIGVLIMEILLFFQGFLIFIKRSMIDNYQFLLLLASMLIVLGLLLILFHQIRQKERQVA